MMSKMHHFFMLNHSSSPLISSLTSFNFMFSVLMYLKFKMNMNLCLSMFMMFMSAFLWWISYSNEFNLKGMNSEVLEKGLKTSMILFIYSEIFFFLSFFWSYFHFFLSPTMELGLNWPPNKINFFDYMNVPLINTLILLSSGATVTASHHFLSAGKKKLSKIMILMTIMLGLTFTELQKLEYDNSFFSISDATFGSSFFMLTGFHGIHVMIGTMFLLTTYVRFHKMVSSKHSALSFEMASWYWHFVDVVWIMLYFLIYYLNG